MTGSEEVPPRVAGGTSEREGSQRERAQSRDAAYWAESVTRFAEGSGAERRRPPADRSAAGLRPALAEELQGVHRDRGRPEEAIAEWRAHFGRFWPKGTRFHGALTPIAPGDVAPIAIPTHAGFRVATGVLVIYADERSFTFMTPEGQKFAGWITFSAAEVQAVDGVDDGGTELDVTVLVRPNDPLYELGWPVMKRFEDAFWVATLRNLAAHLGTPRVEVRTSSVVVDRRRLWRNWRNVRHNAGLGSLAHAVTRPVRAVARRRGARRRPD